MKPNLIVSAVLSAALSLPVSLAVSQDSQFERVGQKRVWGETFYIVRNTDPYGSEDLYGVMDTRGAFHPCGDEPCSTADVHKVADSTGSDYVPKSAVSESGSAGSTATSSNFESEERDEPGGGGGGGGM
ncbi:MAG: hypothetical protein AAF530_11765 [Pseudomonadota bacterium]